ncbi:hypothetical protein FOCC_FOCC009476, partial [Frankliniella occidentalis]
MFKLVAFFAIVAVAAAKPGVIAPVVHSVPVVHAVHAAPVAVSHSSIVQSHSAPVVKAVPVVHAAPIVRTVPVVHAAPVVHSVHAAPLAIHHLKKRGVIAAP